MSTSLSIFLYCTPPCVGGGATFQTFLKFFFHPFSFLVFSSHLIFLGGEPLSRNITGTLPNTIEYLLLPQDWSNIKLVSQSLSPNAFQCNYEAGQE